MRRFPFLKHYPGTNLHEIDLDYVLRISDEAYSTVEALNEWADSHEVEYNALKDSVDGLINNLVNVITPWDSSVEYPIYTIVEYQGTNYIAIKPVPVGAMITNPEYWQPANTVTEQINAIGLVVSSLAENPVYVFDTVQEMQAYANAKAGDNLRTMGYYSPIDGGGAFYHVRDAAPETYYETLDNGLYAELVIETPANIKQFGAVDSTGADTVIDSTAAIQAAIDNAEDVLIPDGLFGVTTLSFRSGQQIKGSGFNAILQALSPTGYMLSCEEELSKFVLGNFRMDFNGQLCRGIYIKRCYDDCEIRNIRTTGEVSSFLYAGVLDTVSQSLVIDNCCTYSLGTLREPEIQLYQVNEVNLKDSKFLRAAASAYPNLLMSACRDAYVRGCSFTRTTAGAVRLTNGSMYNRFMANTWEVVTGYLLTIDSDGGPNNSTSNVIIESPYWNCSKVVKISGANNNLVMVREGEIETDANTTGNLLFSWANATYNVKQNDVITFKAGEGMTYNGVDLSMVSRTIGRFNLQTSFSAELGTYPLYTFFMLYTNGGGQYMVIKTGVSQIAVITFHSDGAITATGSGTVLNVTASTPRTGVLQLIG